MEVITRADQLSVKHARGDEDPEVPKSSKPKRGRKPKKNGNKNKGKKDTGVKNKDKKNTGEKNKGKKNSDTKNKGKKNKDEKSKEEKKVTPAEAAVEKTTKKQRKSSSSAGKGPEASSPVKPLESKKDNKRKSGQQPELETKVKKPIKEKPVKTDKVEDEEKHVPNTFARRYCPEGGIGKKKWCGIVGTFSELIVPNLAAGTKTKAEADFWKFATQFHKDHGNSSDEKVMANVYAKAARSFLAFLDAVPLAKPSNNFSIRS